MNRSKHDRQARPGKVEFATTGIVIGLFMGLVAGLMAEILWDGGMLAMQAACGVGVVVGTVVEAFRFGWGKRPFSPHAQKPRSWETT